MRRLYQNQMSDSEGTLRIEQGGTGAASLEQAAKNLNLITRDMVNQPNGVFLLNKLGSIDKGVLPDSVSDPSSPSLYGARSVLTNETLTLKITNYDSFTVYEASAVGGTVIVKGEDVVFTAGSAEIEGSVTLNGKTYAISVTTLPAVVVTTPYITSPVNGAVGLRLTDLTVTSSAFAISNSTDTHHSSDWQIATDSAFTTLLASTSDDTGNLTSWTVTNMQPSTKYYVRTRQKSSGGKLSDWSAVSNFTTKALGLAGTEQAKLLASDPAASDYFGFSVSLSSDGSTALIGAFLKTGSAGESQGAAYVFTRSGSTWTQQAKLLASDPDATDYFGASVSLSSDGATALVGASQKTGTAGNYQGAAYVFTRSGTTWTQQAKLLASDPAASDLFGISVSLSSDGSTALIGAYGKTGTAGASQGAAYVFTRSGTTWTQQAMLLASDPATNDNFGVSVSLSSDGNTALIGAHYKTGTAGSYQGAAYVFTRTGTTWTQQAKLLASDPAANDRFGYSVSLSSDGNTAIVGAYYKTGTHSQQGAAYVFTRSGTTWTQQAMLLASDPATNDYFGVSVSLSSDGSTALIGAYNKTGTAGSYQGAAYVFTRTGTTWTQQAKLLASDPAAGDYFGISVSLSSDGSVALIGASQRTGTYANEGAAYVFTRSGVTWSQQTKLLASDPAASDYFGRRVSLSSDGATTIVGAFRKNGSFVSQGAAYIKI